MLRFFSRLERSRNLVLLVFCGLLLIGLVAFYIPNTSLSGGNLGAAANAGDEVIAKIGSQEITLKQYRAALMSLSQNFGQGNRLPFSTLKTLGMDKQALDMLVANTVVRDEARSLGLAGTDEEINLLIKRQFVDETGKWIGKEEYLRRLRLNGQDVSEFETSLRNEAAVRKIRNFLISAEQVSDREIEERFKRENTKTETVYATIDLEKVRKGYKPSEEELKAYYDAHQGEFKANEPTRKVEYIFIPTDEVAKIVPVNDEELKTEFEARKQYEYRASVIRLNVPSPADENRVQDQINQLNAKARGSKDVPPEDFAVLAKGNSQDPSAKNGGDLGWIKKEPNKSGQWQQRVYTNGLKPGEIDGPFRDGTSWYLLKVTEQREVPFAQMRPTLVATIQNNKAYKKANELASTAYEKANEYKDMRKAAEEIAKEIKVSADALIKTTPYFKKGDALPDLGKGGGIANNPAFDDAVATLQKGEIGDKVNIPGGFAVPRVVDVLDKGAQLTFDQARNQVESKVRTEREPNLAKARAQELLKQATNAADLERLIKAEGLEVKTDTNFDKFSFPGAAANGLIASNQAREALHTLKEGEVAKAPIKVGAAYLIFAATKRTEPDMGKLADSRESLRQSIISERQGSAYEAFSKAARKRYEDQGKIKIYQDRIDKFFADAAAAQGPQ